ncbi:MAG: glycosyltransferase [Vicinamibacterales bacterium]
MRVGLIIVTHNAAALVERCLRAVALQSRRPDRILVVDNASGDDTVTRVAEVAAELALTVEVVAERDNLGFARANNLAVDALEDCEWVALLNPDAYPDQAWLASLLAAAARHPAAAALGARLMQDGRADVLDGAGDEYHVSGLVWRRGHRQPVAGVPGALVERRVIATCAAAAIYRRRDWIEAGGFDPRFFCYVEDVDLGFRLCLHGREAVRAGCGGRAHGLVHDGRRQCLRRLSRAPQPRVGVREEHAVPPAGVVPAVARGRQHRRTRLVRGTRARRRLSGGQAGRLEGPAVGVARASRPAANASRAGRRRAGAAQPRVAPRQAARPVVPWS